MVSDPAINVNRVKNRYQQGGHNVPEDKIRERYVRSLALLPSAISACNRAFIFDNSGKPNEQTCLAKSTDGKDLETLVEAIPEWLYNLLELEE